MPPLKPTFSLLVCLLIFSGVSTFDLRPYISNQVFSLTNSTLQVDSQGRTYVIAGSQLLRLSRDLQLEQNVALPDRAATMSLSPDDQKLFVCVNGITDRSCYLYNPSDLTATFVDTGVDIVGTGEASATSFATEGSFYVGSYEARMTSNREGLMTLSQYIYRDGTDTHMIRTRDYEITKSGFGRTMLYGFVQGSYAYYVTVDVGNEIEVSNYRVLRVCHITSCPGNSLPCSFDALYEQAIQCDSRFGNLGGEYLCGLSSVKNFNGTSGMILSRCRQGRSSDNIVCSYSLTAIDTNMDLRYDSCSMGQGESRLAWREQFTCRQQDFTDRCDFERPLDDTSNSQQGTLQKIFGNITVNNVATNGNFVTASLAIQVDRISIIVVAYSSSARTTHFIAFYNGENNMTLEVGDSYKVEHVQSAMSTLQWRYNLDHIYASSPSMVIRVLVEECSMHSDCSSCLSDRNPLCGWCVVQNNCSRVSQCANGRSHSDRWIRADHTTSSSGKCITNVITPTQYVMDDPQILTVTVNGPGLPAVLPGETYSCHLADSQGRYNITVPAVSVNDGRTYTCNILNENFNYVGIVSVINFSFISSWGMVPFDTTANSLTIYRCSSARRCSDCLQTDNACGWCSVNKICRGVPTDCMNSGSSTTFLQLMNNQSFRDVCSFILNTNDGYFQHVRVDTDLQLTTSNLHPIETGFSYMCDLGGTILPAIRNGDTRLTCTVDMNQLSILSMNEVVDLVVIWTNGASITHRIDTLSPVNVTLYDCLSDTGCSECVNTRMRTNFQCGWCNITSSCSVMEECSTSIITNGHLCPLSGTNIGLIIGVTFGLIIVIAVIVVSSILIYAIIMTFRKKKSQDTRRKYNASEATIEDPDNNYDAPVYYAAPEPTYNNCNRYEAPEATDSTNNDFQARRATDSTNNYSEAPRATRRDKWIRHPTPGNTSIRVGQELLATLPYITRNRNDEPVYHFEKGDKIIIEELHPDLWSGTVKSSRKQVKFPPKYVGY